MSTINLEFLEAKQLVNGTIQSTITSGTVKFGTESYQGTYYGVMLSYRIGNSDAYAYKMPNITLKYDNVAGYYFRSDDPTDHRSTNPKASYSITGSSYQIMYSNGINHEYTFFPKVEKQANFNLHYNDEAVAISKYFNYGVITVYLNLYVDNVGDYRVYDYGEIYNIENSILSIDAEPLDFNIQYVYPVNVNCRNDRAINMAWDYTNPREYYINDNLLFYPTEATVTISQDQTVKTFTTTEDLNTCPIPANELIPGEATYIVSFTSNYGYSHDGPEQTFTVIGQTSAPEITNITQDSFPTITWNCADQAAWELLIKDSNSVVYHSEMKAGTEQSFTLPVMLEDGSYSVEIRALNIYGYYTDWGSYGFVLSPEKPTAATNLIVSTNANYTVTIDCTAPEDAGTLYVVRRRTPNDKAEIIGEYNNGFTDYYVPVNTTYEYAVRNYVTGYADTDFIDATIKCPGVVIRDGEDLSRFIPLWKNDNEEFDVITNDSRSDTLVQCLGRKYPVNEVGEWITSTRTFTAHVSASDINKLNDINLNSKCVYLQNKDECIPCKMEITDAGEYNGGGRIINFTLTRIDEEMA